MVREKSEPQFCSRSAGNLENQLNGCLREKTDGTYMSALLAVLRRLAFTLLRVGLNNLAACWRNHYSAGKISGWHFGVQSLENFPHPKFRFKYRHGLF